ncbi:MucR family transcriptional regulator [Devosia sp.]|uniref:MucR family transcriptional regulator n=1 Tax=Devosia sp. TaxID=1871048 RepID=UPI003BAC61A5
MNKAITAAPAASNDDVVTYASEIVRAYVSNNPLGASGVAELLKSVHSTLSGLHHPQTQQRKGAVPVHRSITPDHLICLEDGKAVKSLKAHLAGLGMTPDAYRQKWGLPQDYPMVAPNYSKIRSQIAKRSGLGQKK